MVSPSSPFVLETRYLITFSRNGIRTLVKKSFPFKQTVFRVPVSPPVFPSTLRIRSVFPRLLSVYGQIFVRSTTFIYSQRISCIKILQALGGAISQNGGTQQNKGTQETGGKKAYYNPGKERSKIEKKVKKNQENLEPIQQVEEVYKQKERTSRKKKIYMILQHILI